MFKFLCFFLLDANQKSDPSCKPASYWRPPLPTLIKRKAGMEKGNADSMRVLLLIKSLYVYFCTQTCTSTISGDSERQKEQLVLHYTVLPCTSPHSSFVSGPLFPLNFLLGIKYRHQEFQYPLWTESEHQVLNGRTWYSLSFP